ncbi:MAG: type II toxin-antitoxin system Phd/YefM family antitoxin [Nitrospiraceae bacterium]|nr:MAG: type II toxin-antitoxin system Phd/YefM family antitoxin [Nitrospiraceae bacterium]
MKVATVREFRDKATSYFKDDEPVLVTRHGKVAGLYLPIDHPESFPLELRKELLVRLGEFVGRSLEKKGITEGKLLADFNTFKKTRRRR